MRHVTIRATSFLLTLALTLCMFSSLQQEAEGQGGRPDWTPGDYWEYYGNSNFTGQSSYILLKMDVIDQVDLVVNGTTYDTYRCNTAISISGPYPVSGTGYVHFSTTDLSTVKMAVTLAGFDIEVTYTPPLRSFEFPLGDNKIWSSTNLMRSRFTFSNMTTFNNETTTTDFRATGPISLMTPTGTYSVFNVTSRPQGSIDNTTTSFYSDTVGYIVKSESTPLGVPIPVNLTLKSYNYQKSPIDQVQDSSVLLLATLGVILLIAIPVVVYLLRRSRKTVSEPPEGPIYGQADDEEEYTYRPPPPS